MPASHQPEPLDLRLHQVPHDFARLFSRPDRLADPLYVVTPVFNFSRARARWQHYEDFAKMVAASGAILYTVEIAFADRAFAVTESQNPRHLQLRASHELWLKERAINLAVQRLPADWKYVAWIDADCVFARCDWADETLHALQHWPVVQMWSQLIDLNRDGEALGKTLVSFAFVFCGGEIPSGYGPGAGQVFGSPGLAWACRREAWDQFGGLFDVSILGAGDWYFASCLAGTLNSMIGLRNDFTPGLRRHLDFYAGRMAESRWRQRSLLGNLGCVRGLALHCRHGSRLQRQYGSRGKILTAHGFDPDLDLIPDWQGLYQLTNRRPQLRRDIQRYFAARKEDE
jgi:hypothetical protein